MSIKLFHLLRTQTEPSQRCDELLACIDQHYLQTAQMLLPNFSRSDSIKCPRVTLSNSICWVLNVQLALLYIRELIWPPYTTSYNLKTGIPLHFFNLPNCSSLMSSDHLNSTSCFHDQHRDFYMH